MCWTDDPIADYDRYSAKREKELEKLPVCCDCDEHIQDEYCYEFNDEYICEKCLEKYHRKAVEDCG